MYSKTYWITCPPDNGTALLAHYDDVIAGTIRESARHISHQMIQVADGKWLLVSNYKSRQDAEDSIPMVQELIKPMVETLAMTLEVIGEGETIREIS